MKFFLKSFLIILISVCFLEGYAWNALGHQVVAQIAYDRLNPDVKTKVDKMVFDFSKEYPAMVYFNQIAPWPDYLRSQKIETFTHWHYIDVPFSADGSAIKQEMDSDNVIWAIHKIEPILSNKKANPYEKARFLAFMVHLVGDSHQPLHASTRVSEAHPEGDRGGNLFFIQFPEKKPHSMALHKLWDQGMDLFLNCTTFNCIALLSEQITLDYPESSFGAKVNDLSAEHWVNESFLIAESFVYSTREGSIPSEDYLQHGKEIVKQRVALAGYRLANVLNALLA